MYQYSFLGAPGAQGGLQLHITYIPSQVQWSYLGDATIAEAMGKDAGELQVAKDAWIAKARQFLGKRKGVEQAEEKSNVPKKFRKKAMAWCVALH